MASLVYNKFKTAVLTGTYDLSSNTVKTALVTSSYTADQDAHDFFDDITNEVSGTGYSSGGATLANKTVTQDNTNNRGVFDADDPSWASSTITARGAVIYKSTGTSSTSALICYIDFGQDYTSSVGTFSIVFNASGILYIG